MENSTEVPQKLKTRTTIEPSNLTSESISKRTESRVLKRYLKSQVYSSTIYKSQEVETIQCPSTDGLLNRSCYIHTVEYYLALKRKEILSHVKTWMNLKVITVSETSHL